MVAVNLIALTTFTVLKPPCSQSQATVSTTIPNLRGAVTDPPAVNIYSLENRPGTFYTVLAEIGEITCLT